MSTETKQEWISVKDGGDNIIFDYEGSEYRAGRAEGISSGSLMEKYCDGRIDKGGYMWRCYAEKTTHNPQGCHYEYRCIYDEEGKQIKIVSAINKPSLKIKQ